jgi:hypothetical protein
MYTFGMSTRCRKNPSDMPDSDPLIALALLEGAAIKSGWNRNDRVDVPIGWILDFASLVKKLKGSDDLLM